MIEENNIYNIDCLEGIKQVRSKSVKLIVADPPYFLGMTYNGQKGSFVDLSICKPFYNQLFAEFNRVLTPNGEIFYFTDWRGYAFYYPLLDKHLTIRNLIVWDKISGPGNFYSFTHELIIYATKENYCPNKFGTNIWRSKSFASGAKRTNGEKVHATQKPLELIQRMINDCTDENELVLDPFTGSGTTAIVCKQLNRKFIGFELDLANFDVMKNRLNQPYQQIIKLTV